MTRAYHGVQACKCGADCQPTEARLCYWTVDDSLLAETVQKAFGDFVPTQVQYVETIVTTARDCRICVRSDAKDASASIVPVFCAFSRSYWKISAF